MRKKGIRKLSVVLACGGTGGHIYPAVAVGLEVGRRFPGTEVWFMGRKKGMECEVAEHYGFRFASINAQRLPGKSPLRVVLFGVLTIAAVSKATATLLWIRPPVVVGFGGYVSFPGVVSAAMLGIPVYLHEQNIIPGKVNRWLSRWAKAMFVSFDKTSRLVHCPAVKTGNPTRFAAKPDTDSKTCRRALGLDSNRTTILVFGGSQGAVSINRATVDFAEIEKDNGELQILHLTGKGGFEEVSKAYNNAQLTGESGSSLKIRVLHYLEEMELGFGAADVVICRAGATAIAELMEFGKPAILVPYPHAAESHQAENADFLAKNGAAIVIDDASLTGQKISDTVRELTAQPQRLIAMAGKAKGLFTGSAASRLLDEIAFLIE